MGWLKIKFKESSVLNSLVAIAALSSLLLFIALNILLIEFFRQGHLTLANFIWTEVFVFAVYSLFSLYFSVNVKRPINSLRKTYQDFLRNRDIDSLIAPPIQLLPEMPQAFSLIETMLDRQVSIKLSAKQAEFLALQNQINPHFLYNTLEAIRCDAMLAGLDNIAETTEALSTFFRYTITEMGSLVTLEDELENVRNYFIIQQYRFGEKLKMNINLPQENLDILQLPYPKLTLQPIVENAIFHGLENKIEGGTITIDFDITEDKIHVNIIDQGVGIPEEQLLKINENLLNPSSPVISDVKQKNIGIAVNNVNRRIKLIFGEKYGIHIFSTLGFGTEVCITTPLAGVSHIH